jgi:hypothetical protein
VKMDKNYFNGPVNNNSYSSIEIAACNSYHSPSGKYVWTSNGSYMDTIPNNHSGDSIITVNLNVTSIDTSLTMDHATLTSKASGAGYQWINCNNGNAPIEGETGRSFTAGYSGNYAVVINKNGCIDTSSCYALLVTGIQQRQTENKITISPNPTSGDLYIDLGKEYEAMIVSIRNFTSQLISTSQYFKADKLHLRIEGEAGMYFINIVTSEGNQTTFKVVKN